jgi:hypothetical protein
MDACETTSKKRKNFHIGNHPMSKSEKSGEGQSWQMTEVNGIAEKHLVDCICINTKALIHLFSFRFI